MPKLSGLPPTRSAARQELAERLGVSAEELHVWIEARGTPPLEPFLEALDLLEPSIYARANRMGPTFRLGSDPDLEVLFGELPLRRSMTADTYRSRSLR